MKIRVKYTDLANAERLGEVVGGKHSMTKLMICSKRDDYVAPPPTEVYEKIIYG